MDTLQPTSFKVLLIGDSCTDIFVYGTVKRINPEAPVPILDYTRTEIRQGMTWNVYNNLKAFGVDITVLTNKEKIIKTRYIDEKINQQILRVDEEQQCKPLEYDLPKNKFDALIISDYNKGFISQERIFQLVEEFDGPIFIDSKKTILPINGAYIKINEEEFKKLDSKSSNLIVTKGSNGAEYKGKLYPGEKVNVFDVVGAGDTFLSALTYGYLKYGSIEKSIPLANKAAAIAVSYPGTYVLTEEDVKSLCD